MGILAIMLFSTACGSGDTSSAPPAPAATAAESAAAGGTFLPERRALGGNHFYSADSLWGGSSDELTFGAGTTANNALLDRMVIRNAQISMNTLYFEETVANIAEIIAAYGGFVENSNMWMLTIRGEDLWRADYVLRVPVDYFDSANNAIVNLGEIVSFSASSEDITTQFQDLESRMNIRLEEERRLIEMIENTTDLEDLLTLERRLSDLRLTIEGQRRRLDNLDNLASFSTINLFLQEITEEEAGIIPTGAEGDGIIARISTAFGGSINFSLILLENIAVAIAALILPVSIIAALVFVGFKVVTMKVQKRS